MSTRNFIISQACYVVSEGSRGLFFFFPLVLGILASLSYVR